MKIISNNSQEIGSLLEDKFQWIENKSVLSMLNGEEFLNIIRKEEIGKDKLINIDKLNITGDLFIFDLLNEVKKKVKIRSNYFLVDEYEKGKKDIKEVFQKKAEIVDPLNFTMDFWKEIFRVYFNTITRNFHNKKIILISFKINEDFRILENEYVELNVEEKKIVKKINDLLNNLENLIRKMLPNINVISINNKVNMVNIESRELVIEKSFININEEKVSLSKFNGEKQFSSFNTIRYYFESAKIYNKNKLIIIFSAFPTDSAKYNYINTLKAVDCNKLFILDDYGTKGSYYIGLDGSLDIETSIMSLISLVMSKNNINFKDIISVGSSKGGSAAIYYGMKYNFGNIIAGAPQYRIGTYLSDLSIKDYGNEIFGEISDATRLKYDHILRLISGKKDSKIYILTSDGDNQYKKLLKDFEYFSESFKVNLEIEKCNINNHGEISKVFPEFMNNKVAMILKKGCINRSFINRVKQLLKE